MPDIQLWPDWKIVREIGSGSYGKVYEIHRQNGIYLERAALKVIRIPQNQADLEQLRMDGIQPEATEAYLERHVEEIRNEKNEGVRKYYTGLPVTSASLIFPFRNRSITFGTSVDTGQCAAHWAFLHFRHLAASCLIEDTAFPPWLYSRKGSAGRPAKRYVALCSYRDCSCLLFIFSEQKA